MRDCLRKFKVFPTRYGAMRYSIKHFIHTDAFGGLLLMVAACIALISANTPLRYFYQTVVQSHDVLFVVNDGLMAIFFLLVGLEIKREIVTGELADKAKALQPVFAAIGGMVVPALLYLIVAKNNPETIKGWAIPCATDIAFALGVLALLGSRVPVAIKVLLTAIAILDDLGAILIIAFFYSDTLNWFFACIPLTALIGLMALNKMNERHLLSYLFCGAVLWYGFLKLGIHPTLAGVVTALAIPLQVTHKKKSFTPAGTLEHFLHPWVAFCIMPLFALCNAGLSFAGMEIKAVTQAIPLGIISGLLIGKPLGIMLGLFVGHITGLAKKASSMRWMDYVGMGFLCGVGFTMALFIGDLAFKDPSLAVEVKLGVLSASLLSAGIGWTVCRATFKRA